MTAFARHEIHEPWGHAVWELRSVNHRYLEMSLRLPEELRSLEPAIRERVNAQVKRGKLDITLRLKRTPDGTQELRINMDLARQLAAASKEVAALLPGERPPGSMDLMRWPGVIEAGEEDIDRISEGLLRALDAALNVLVETRRREGERLDSIISPRLSAIGEEIKQVRGHMPQIVEHVRTRLHERLAEFKAELDAGRLEQEMAMLLQKMDVEEELDRLDTHIAEVTRVLGQKGAVGRRLDFLLQELHREANTLGAKSVHPEMTRASVELKVLIEQIREQIQNIE